MPDPLPRPSVDNPNRYCPDCHQLIGVVIRHNDEDRLLIDSHLYLAARLECTCGRVFHWRAGDEHLRRATPRHPAAWPSC